MNNCTTVKGAAAVPLQGLSFWESSPPMGPPENLTSQHENQEGRRRRLPCRPRTRRCLLKGCEQRFHPRQARQRYCAHTVYVCFNNVAGRLRGSVRRASGLVLTDYLSKWAECEARNLRNSSLACACLNFLVGLPGDREWRPRRLTVAYQASADNGHIHGFEICHVLSFRSPR